MLMVSISPGSSGSLCVLWDKLLPCFHCSLQVKSNIIFICTDIEVKCYSTRTNKNVDE